MDRFSAYSVVNLSLLVIVWVGFVFLLHLAIGLNAIWKVLLAAIILVPAAGYFVQYLVTPISNSLVSRLYDHLDSK
jgi:hypothetical protein